ncbi:MAG: hypothetical protein H0T62_02430 [Parachlamydiaceae bacterium]|nr:hypothetical protein [Parachlamydiaceae bacterium]
MINNGIKECVKANCTFFEEKIKQQEFIESWLGRFIILLGEDGLITNLARPIFHCLSYFKNASDALKRWPIKISLKRPESISIEDSIKVLRFSIQKSKKGEFGSIISQLTSKIIETMPHYEKMKSGKIYNFEMSKRLSDLALISLKNRGWISNTVLSHLVKHPEFLNCLCRFDLASLLIAQIDDEAKDMIMIKLRHLGLPLHISIKKLDGVMTHIRHVLEDHFPLAYGLVESGKGRLGPYSSNAIVWLANGDEKMLLDYIGMFSSNQSSIEFIKKEWKNNKYSSERWNALFWFAEALKRKEAPEVPRWVTVRVSSEPSFFGESVGLWLGGLYGYRHQLKRLRFINDENKIMPALLDIIQLDQAKKRQFELSCQYLRNSLTRSMILGEFSLERSIMTCLCTSQAFSSKFLAILDTKNHTFFKELQDEALVKVLADKLRVTGECYPSDIVPILDKDCTISGAFKTIPADILTQIWNWLSPDNAGRLSTTCRRLFHFIAGPQGSPIWKAQGLGSIGAVRTMYGLMKIIDHNWTESERNDPVKQQGFQVFLSTLAAAWPEMSYLSKGMINECKDPGGQGTRERTQF